MKKDAATIQKWFSESEAIVIGAGAGLSTSAGFTYSGERFEKYFSDFAKKYGFRDMYSGGFYPYPSLEEFWAYWSRYVYINRYDQTHSPLPRLRKADVYESSFGQHLCRRRGLARGI